MECSRNCSDNVRKCFGFFSEIFQKCSRKIPNLFSEILRKIVRILFFQTLLPLREGLSDVHLKLRFCASRTSLGTISWITYLLQRTCSKLFTLRIDRELLAEDHKNAEKRPCRLCSDRKLHVSHRTKYYKKSNRKIWRSWNPPWLCPLRTEKTKNSTKLSGNVQEMFGYFSGNVQEISRTCSGNLREMSRKCPGNFRKCSRYFPENSWNFHVISVFSVQGQ